MQAHAVQTQHVLALVENCKWKILVPNFKHRLANCHKLQMGRDSSKLRGLNCISCLSMSILDSLCSPSNQLVKADAILSTVSGELKFSQLIRGYLYLVDVTCRSAKVALAAIPVHHGKSASAVPRGSDAAQENLNSA
jgi:hypothetical protein